MLFYLIEGLEGTEIILASTSPRRFELLKSLGLEFKVVASNVEENVSSPENSPDQIALLNAQLKGRKVAKQYPNALVISADTVVSLNNKILGKPENEDDAFRMLKYLSGKIHTVYTAFGLI
ncbi:MAG TPA: septum formation inhibitor Maf, partial [Calditrichaeota bacterium]|nr:septum formation inhibitor Maf [Calditrichota bacterium]